METTTVKTVLEYAMMPIQRYEFICQGCFMVKTINDYAKGNLGAYCTECKG